MNSEGHAKDCPILSDDNLPCVCGVIPVVRPPMTAGEMKHTAGPWAVNPMCAQVDAFTDKVPVAVCALLWPTLLRSEAETEANARLIASAPDLLEACKAALDSAQAIDPEQTAAFALCRAAIAKATGKTP